jgi:hypothetical protein
MNNHTENKQNIIKKFISSAVKEVMNETPSPTTVNSPIYKISQKLIGIIEKAVDRVEPSEQAEIYTRVAEFLHKRAAYIKSTNESLNEKKYTNIQMHANEFGSKIKTCIETVETLKDDLDEISNTIFNPDARSTVVGGVDVSDKSHLKMISFMAGSKNSGKKYLDSDKYSVVLDTLKSKLESLYKLTTDVAMGSSKKEPAIKKEESEVTKKPTLKKELPLKNESKSIKEADDVFGTLGKSLNPNFTSDRFEYVLWGIAPNKTEEELLVSKVKGEFITDLHDAQKIKDTLEKLYHCKNVRIQKIDKLDNNVNDKFAKSVNI